MTADMTQLKAEMTAEMTQLKAQMAKQQAETTAMEKKVSAMTQENARTNALLEQLLEQRTRQLDNLDPQQQQESQQQEATTPLREINNHNMRDLFHKFRESAPKFFTRIMQLALGPNKMAFGNCSGGSHHPAHDREIFQHCWKVTYRMFGFAGEERKKKLKECKVKCDATGRNTRSTQGFKRWLTANNLQPINYLQN